MVNARHDLLLRSLITPKLVGNHHSRHILAALEQLGCPLGQEFLGSRFVASALDQDLQYSPILINGAPQIVLLPADFEEDLSGSEATLPPPRPLRTVRTSFKVHGSSMSSFVGSFLLFGMPPYVRVGLLVTVQVENN
jgi:hypothetical protein